MPIPEPGWDDEGRRLSPLTDALSAVVIVGADSAATSLVALGLAHAQAERRRVVIGDLVGDLPELESIIPRHDPHGLSDSFTYGISLNRIGYPVEPGGNLYIMPSGSEPVATELIIGHPRWQRLVAGFREVGALLVLVVEPTAPALERLIPMTDGAILVGDTRLEAPSHVIARARPRGPRLVPASSDVSATEPQGRSSSTTGRGAGSVSTTRMTSAVTGPTPAAEARARKATDDAGGSGRRIGVIIAAALGLVTVVLASLLMARFSGWGRPDVTSSEPVKSAETMPVVPVATTPQALPIENPQDSARAAAYAVVIVAANTVAGADDNLLRVDDLPAATTSPSIDGGAVWYKVFVGAFVRREEAEAFRDSLRRSGRADETVQRIASLPFALLVADAVVPDSIALVRRTYRDRGLATYALMQPDGTARIYAGAFTTPEEAMHLAPMLRATGLQPRIVYRVGRPF